MRVHHTICRGIDVHKKSVTACLMWGPANQEPEFEIRRFGTMTSELKALAEWLKQAHCEIAAMESTGAYWKPVWNVLEREIPLIPPALGNSADVWKPLVSGRQVDIIGQTAAFRRPRSPRSTSSPTFKPKFPLTRSATADFEWEN